MAKCLLTSRKLNTAVLGLLITALLGGNPSPNNAEDIISQSNSVIWTRNGRFGKNGITPLPEQWSYNAPANTTHLYEYSPNKLIGISLLYSSYPVILPSDSVSVYQTDISGQIKLIPASFGFIRRQSSPASEYNPIIGIQTNERTIYFAENHQLKALNSDLTPDLTFGSVPSSSLPIFELLSVFTIMPDNKIVLLDYFGDFYQLDANATNITKTGHVPISSGLKYPFNKFSGLINLVKEINEDGNLKYYQVDSYDIFGQIVKSGKINPAQSQIRYCEGNSVELPDGGFALGCDSYYEYMFLAYANQQKFRTILSTTDMVEPDPRFNSCTPETCPCISNFTLFTVQADGKYVLADFIDYGLPTATLKISRCLPNTNYDSTFGDQGILRIPFPKQTLLLKDLLVQRDGQIVLAFAQDPNIDMNYADKDLRGFFLMKLAPVNVRHQQFLPVTLRENLRQN